MSLTDECRPWDSWLKIIRCFFVHHRKIPLYSLSDAGAHWSSNDQLIWDLTGKRGYDWTLVKNFLNHLLLLQSNFWLVHIITKHFTTTVCSFSWHVLTKHILTKIQEGSTFSKICSHRKATTIKWDFHTGVFLWVCKQLFYKTPVNNTCKSRLDYRTAIPKNFTNWQENTHDRVLYITIAGKSARNFI